MNCSVHQVLKIVLKIALLVLSCSIYLAVAIQQGFQLDIFNMDRWVGFGCCFSYIGQILELEMFIVRFEMTVYFGIIQAKAILKFNFHSFLFWTHRLDWKQQIVAFTTDGIFILVFVCALIFHSHQTEATYRLDFIWKLQATGMLMSSCYSNKWFVFRERLLKSSGMELVQGWNFDFELLNDDSVKIQNIVLSRCTLKKKLLSHKFNQLILGFHQSIILKVTFISNISLCISSYSIQL